jgi:chemotaxis protein MotB
MRRRMQPLAFCGLVFGALALSGCQWVSKGQLTAADSQNRILNEQSKAQLAEIENLKAHNRTVENQLIQAEEELADLDQRIGVDRKQMANFQRERRQLKGQVETLISNPRGGAPVADPRLSDLTRKYDWLVFDPETGASKFDTDVLFESGQTELRPDARKVLDQLAKLLTAPEAADLRIMIVGHSDDRGIAKKPVRENYADNWRLSTARALEVAKYLEKVGVAERQIGVVGYGSHQPIAPNTSAAERHLNRRVEIFVMGPETPVVGWMDPPTRTY